MPPISTAIVSCIIGKFLPASLAKSFAPAFFATATTPSCTTEIPAALPKLLTVSFPTFFTACLMSCSPFTTPTRLVKLETVAVTKAASLPAAVAFFTDGATASSLELITLLFFISLTVFSILYLVACVRICASAFTSSFSILTLVTASGQSTAFLFVLKIFLPNKVSDASLIFAAPASVYFFAIYSWLFNAPLDLFSEALVLARFASSLAIVLICSGVKSEP